MGDDRRSGPTRLYVLGTIHSNHTRSKAYSLDVLAEAFRRAEPDQLLAEITPDRIAEAYRSFRYDGKVTEPRTAVFPAYVDCAFPMTRELDFESSALPDGRRPWPMSGRRRWRASRSEEHTSALTHL